MNNENWQPGDLALCVRGGGPEWVGHFWENNADYELRCGAIYRVRWVGLTEDIESSFEGLKFEGLDWGWLSDRFRKIHPHTPDEEDAETIALLNGKNVPVREGF